eukprot:TRINITY_DN3490_c1_g1_i9.p2 TRINITY_DN3490_c1_g1~~TRINITY_DN3490_c1_g1_i9.p2  ORF type:complete len:221 (+),score=-36.82 TRINITY_DN3490_c1_g1_i9:281-943(+)
MVIQQCYYIQQVFYLSAMSIIMMVKLHMIQNTKMQHLFCLLITYIFIISFKKEKVCALHSIKLLRLQIIMKALIVNFFFIQQKKLKSLKYLKKNFLKKTKIHITKDFQVFQHALNIQLFQHCYFVYSYQQIKKIVVNSYKTVQNKFNTTQIIHISTQIQILQVTKFQITCRKNTQQNFHKIHYKLSQSQQNIYRQNTLGNNLSQFSNIFFLSYNQYQCYY